MSLASLPELASLDTPGGGVRIPPDMTVPLTPRVRCLLDTPELRRLAGVSQLGLVSLVYPGAVHTRLEHSLGVYRLALRFLAVLRHDPGFAAVVGPEDAAAFLVASLVHDIGHWAFCHPLEDMGLAEIPRHETLVPRLLAGAPAAVLERQWGLAPDRIAALVLGTAGDPAGRILASLLSGPVDVDKMDYLVRDSHHAGVPYGRHFDQDRLVASLCLDATGRQLAITDKGRTAAELMVFARYVMFSEVYWHHAVRAATAMLQRAVWVVRPAIDPAALVRFDDAAFVRWLTAAAAGTPAAPLVDGLFGPLRRLHKRVATFDAVRHPEVHGALRGRGYADTVTISRRLAAVLSTRHGIPTPADSLLLDTPPVEKEVEFHLAVRDTASPAWRPLAELSPVVRSLAHEQFDSLVKRVRIYAPAGQAERIAACPDLGRLLIESAAG